MNNRIYDSIYSLLVPIADIGLLGLAFLGINWCIVKAIMYLAKDLFNFDLTNKFWQLTLALLLSRVIIYDFGLTRK